MWNIFTIVNKVRNSSLNLLYNSIAIFATVMLAMFVIEDNMLRLIALAGIRVFYGIIRVMTFLPIYGAKCLGFGKWTFYPLLLKNAVNVLILSGVSILFKIIFLAFSWSSLLVGVLFTIIVGFASALIFVLNRSDRKFVLDRIKLHFPLK